MTPTISVIIPSHNEGTRLLLTVRSALCNDSEVTEVVVVDDGSDDGSADLLWEMFQNDGRLKILSEDGLGTCKAGNRGAAVATADILVRTDAHTLFPLKALDRLAETLLDKSIGMVGPAFAQWEDPSLFQGLGMYIKDDGLNIDWLPPSNGANKLFEAMILPGGCVALRRPMFEEIGGWDKGMTRFGLDEELSLRIWRRGFRCLVDPTVTVQHYFRSKHPYEVTAAGVAYNHMRTGILHLTDSGLQRMFAFYQTEPYMPEVMSCLIKNQVQEDRRCLDAVCPNDAAWLSEKFPKQGAQGG